MLFIGVHVLAIRYNGNRTAAAHDSVPILSALWLFVIDLRYV
jgi:hypothetical protein